MVPNPYWKDLAERTLAAFVIGLGSVIPLDGLDVLHADWRSALAAGVTMAVGSAIKGLIAKFVGNRQSASLAPKV